MVGKDEFSDLPELIPRNEKPTKIETKNIIKNENNIKKKDMRIIFPPEALKSKIDKTAKFVALNGEEFEYKIIQKKGEDPEFNFLKEVNPYHGYYKMCITHFLKQISSASSSDLKLTAPEAPTPKTVTKNTKLKINEVLKKKQENKIKRNIPKSDQLPIIYNLEIPKSLSPLELDTIKLTARFVAKNGLDFLGVIAGRESRNQRFDFLKIGNKHFEFFSKLVDIYKLCMFPDLSPEMNQKLHFFAGKENKIKILDLIYSKKEFIDYQKQKQKEEEEKKKEEAEISIDWNDFTVVETVEFQDDDYYYTEKLETNQDESDDEMEIDDNEELEKERNRIEEEEDLGDKVIVDNYQRSNRILSNAHKKTQFVKDPVTGQVIPKEQSEEHMRIQLIDPIYRRNKEREMEKFKTTNIVDSSNLIQNLSEFAKQRTDIFGKKEVKEGETLENDSSTKKNQYLWDGRVKTIPLINKQKEMIQNQKKNVNTSSSYLGKPPADISMDDYERIKRKAEMAAQSTTQQQITPPTMQFSPFTNPFFNQDKMIGKKRKIEDIMDSGSSQQKKKKQKVVRLKEKEWIEKHGNSCKISVVVPKEENKDWKTKGQTEILELSMETKVFDVLKKISELTNIPTNKQRLNVVNIGFLKPSKTLGFYNCLPDQSLSLVLKKKKKK